MERITQPTTAVPLEVQRVLDAMTEENWLQKSHCYFEDGKACFLGRLNVLNGKSDPNTMRDFGASIRDLAGKSYLKYGLPLIDLNDTAETLSDFKSKIIALYQIQ